MSNGDPGEPLNLRDLPRGEESFRDATLIEHLDGAGVKTAGSRSVDILIGASFDDDDVDPRQRQLARQHQPGRAASCDHHRMSVIALSERSHPFHELLAPSGSGRDRLSERVMVSTFGSLAASPLPRVTL